MHPVRITGAATSVDLAASPDEAPAFGIESRVLSARIDKRTAVNRSFNVHRFRADRLASPVKVRSEIEARVCGSAPLETRSSGRRQSPTLGTPATQPVLPDTLDSSENEPADTKWSLIPCELPWGKYYIDYKTGELPGPDGSCFFFRSPTPAGKHRAAQACEPCRERRRKCSGERPCVGCIEKGVDCTYSDNLHTATISQPQSADSELKRPTIVATGAITTPHIQRKAKHPPLPDSRSSPPASRVHKGDSINGADADNTSRLTPSMTELGNTRGLTSAEYIASATSEPLPGTLFHAAGTPAQDGWNGNTEAAHDAPVAAGDTEGSPDLGWWLASAPDPATWFLSAPSAETLPLVPSSAPSFQAPGTATPSELAYPYEEDVFWSMQSALFPIGDGEAQSEPVPAASSHTITLTSRSVTDYRDARESMAVYLDPYILPSYIPNSASSELMHSGCVTFGPGRGVDGFGLEQPPTTAAPFAG